MVYHAMGKSNFVDCNKRKQNDLLWIDEEVKKAGMNATAQQHFSIGV